MKKRTGALTTGTGLAVYSFWPFTQSKAKEIEGATIQFDEELARSVQVNTTNIDVTYADDNG